MLTATQAANQNNWGVLDLRSKVTHWGLQGQAGYDAEGNTETYVYTALNVLSKQWTTTSYTVDYLKQDGYLEKSTTGSGTGQVTTTNTSLYDAFGRRIAIDTHAAGQTTDQVRAFAYDAEGQILQRRDGSAVNDTTFSVTSNGGYAVHHYAYVNGQQIGDVDEGGGIDVLSGVTGFSSSDTGTSNYVVQEGDTLTSIAQAVYGDASLWYVVADANGLTSDDDLVEGQTLKLPQVTTNSNTSTTFKPYNPNQISGSTTPSLPQAPVPAPSNQHCNTLAEIVVIAVVIVVSIYTAGAAAEAFGATTTAGESTFAVGASAMSGSYGVAGIAAAAVGGAAGNAAGQLVGDAEGIHQGFSWGEVAGAGLGAGVTAGLSGAITGGASIKSLADADTWAADAKLAGVGAAGAIGSYAGEKLVGQPAHFSWANIAAAALSTEITAKLNLAGTLEQKMGQAVDNPFAENVVGGLVNGAIDSETARLLGGDAANGRQIFEDAFGNALGNAAIAGIQAENARSATKPAQAAIEINPGSPQLQVSDLNMPLAPISPVPYTVQSGDSLSGILGTSDPAAIGAFMQANGLTSSTIYPGEQLVFPSGGYTDSNAALGKATLNVDNQRIAALRASQSNNAYGTGIQWMSAGEREEMLDAFPSATYGTSPGVGSSAGVVGDYINMMNQVGSYAQAAIGGGYAGVRAIPDEIDGAVASAWNGVKNWASAAKFDAVSLWNNGVGADLNQLEDGLTQLPGEVQALPGEAQRWGIGMGVKLVQGGEQLLNYLQTTPGTQITYDAAYKLTSNAPMIAFAVGTDGFGEAADGLAGGTEALDALGGTADAAATASAHPLEGWTAQQVVDYANSLGVQTDRDQLILWSGLGPGREGILRSQAWAAEFGGTTLEMTPGGSWLDSMNIFGDNSPFTRVQAKQIWAQVSQSAAQQASGQVRVTLGWLQPDSIFEQVEYPTFMANPNVTGVDKIYLKSKYGIQGSH